MPKNKKKGGHKGSDRLSRLGSQPPTDDENDAADNWSTASVLSDDVTSLPESGGDADVVDESSAQDDFEDKLKECIEGTSQKSAQGRKICLEGIQKVFSKKYVVDFLADRKETLSDCLARCVKKGKGEEQALAANCISLLIIQLGQDADSIFADLQPSMLTIMADNSVSLKARSKCATALAICSFLACDDAEKIKEVMKSLEDIFKCSYQKGDKSIPSHSPEVSHLHSQAVSAWCLLLSISPSYIVQELVNSHVGRMPDLLKNQDLELRISAGEAIALMYELGREEDEDFEGSNMKELIELLKQLATDSHKYRAKKDRRQQRSSFRDILRSIEEMESPEMNIKFGIENLYIDSWVRKKQYDAFCMVIGSGIYQHLQENVLLREVFGLGPPLPTGAKPANKLTKFERNMYNAAAFKARTKARSKHRDKRAVTVNGF
ncbi:interferon-related developmental regulator 1-like [Gigantopelta aegis]|uniref:interferon-related developmental regulator 1-like n=1 Tax=Gigantopelta aegis TaxID=1735272 RepID=UPI001B889A90|nr:interferon-related developmental regulator 1-like [Gigantopelta aegis]